MAGTRSPMPPSLPNPNSKETAPPPVATSSEAGALLASQETPPALSAQDALAAHRADPSQPLPPLAGVRWVGEDLSGLNFSGQDCSGADLSRCCLDQAVFLGANLRGATLYECSARQAEFGGADLSQANLLRADLEQASLGQANLTDARLDDANLSQASLVSVDARGASFSLCNLAFARLNDARLEGTNFAQAKMRGAVLDQANVEGAVFLGADMRACQLRHLSGQRSADWIGVDLRDVDFTGAYLLRRHVRDQNYLHEFRQQSKGHEWLYWVWWLTSDCGRSMLRWGMFTGTLVMLFAVAYLFVDVDYGPHQGFLSPVYFSLVTMTTLGYGDVLPASTPAQIVTMFEVATGYLMLGGLVSILSSKLARRAD